MISHSAVKVSSAQSNNYDLGKWVAVFSSRIFNSAVTGSDDYDMMTVERTCFWRTFPVLSRRAQSNTVNSLNKLMRVGRTALVKPWSSLCHTHHCIGGKTTA